MRTVRFFFLHVILFYQAFASLSICYPELDITETACQAKISQCALGNIQLVWEYCPPITAAPTFIGDAKVGGGGDSGNNDMGLYGVQVGRRRILKTNRVLQPNPPGPNPPSANLPGPNPATPSVPLGNCVCRSCADFQCKASCSNDTTCIWSESTGLCSEIIGGAGRILQPPPPKAPNSPTSSPTAPLCPVTPTGKPTQHPINQPSRSPTTRPSESPSNYPTNSPTNFPTASPTHSPTCNLGTVTCCFSVDMEFIQLFVDDEEITYLVQNQTNFSKRNKAKVVSFLEPPEIAVFGLVGLQTDEILLPKFEVACICTRPGCSWITCRGMSR